MEKTHYAAIASRRLCYFESHYKFPVYASRRRSLIYLQQFVNTVWAEHGRARVNPPAVFAGMWGTVKRGNSHCFYSECDGYSKIALSSEQQNIQITLHELTHALGYGSISNPHTRAFVGKYFLLLEQYAECNLAELVHASGMFNIKY